MTTLSRRVSRANWTDRAWKSHYVQQTIRFVRLFVVAFVTQLIVWSQHGVGQHMDWKVLASLAVAALEFVWREIFPTTPPTEPDPPAPQEDPTASDTPVADPPEAPPVDDMPKTVARKRTTPAKSTASRRRR